MKFLDYFFNPESVAVIGASRGPGKLGYTILENLKLSFQGPLYPINPFVPEIMGLDSYSNILDVPEKIDLAIIALPAEKVSKAVQECIEKKIKACIIVSSGFSEIGQKEREEELKKISKRKIRVIGPNCLGTYTKGLDMFFFPLKKLKRPDEGPISFITQSGAVGAALLDSLSQSGVGIAKFASFGNKIDVNEIDLLEYLDNDLETRCIAIYLESIDNGKNFVDLCKRITAKKPIVILKAGRTPKGKEAVMSHTGALAGESKIYSAAFKQAGIIEAKKIEEIFDFSKILASQLALKTNKIAIVTDGGGFGIIASDEAEKAGFEIVEFGKDTEKKLKRILPKHAIYKNPVDLTGDATVERYREVLEVVFSDKNVSGVICISLFQIPTLTDEIIDVLRDAKIFGKPFCVCTMGGEYTQGLVKRLEKVGVPVYSTPSRAVNAMKVLYEYGKIRKK